MSFSARWVGGDLSNPESLLYMPLFPFASFIVFLGVY